MAEPPNLTRDHTKKNLKIKKSRADMWHKVNVINANGNDQIETYFQR